MVYSKADLISIFLTHGLAHVAQWDLAIIRMIYLAHISLVGSVLHMQMDPAQPFTTAGEELDDLYHASV